MTTLKQLRKQIDRIDHKILQLLNQRADLALRGGAVKKKHGHPAFDGRREAEIVGRLTRANPGPFSSRSIQEVFRVILRNSRRLVASAKK